MRLNDKMLDYLIKVYERRACWSGKRITEQFREQSREVVSALKELRDKRKQMQIPVEGTVR